MDVASAFTERFNRFSRGLGDRYEPFVRQHLAQVYLVLGSTAATAAIGALLQVKGILDMGMLAVIGSLLLVLGLHFYLDNGKNYYNRLGMLLGFGFCSGQTLGPMLTYISLVNPAIIFTALTGTAVTFVSLSLAALLAERGKYLYLGGMLVSVINTMVLISLFNLLFKSYFVQMFQLYVGVFVMAAFIIYDTQSIVEKCRFGNRDVVQHALDLFFDVLSLFRRLLLILNQKEEQKQRDERRKRH